jgi:hypothetical protein
MLFPPVVVGKAKYAITSEIRHPALFPTINFPAFRSDQHIAAYWKQHIQATTNTVRPITSGHLISKSRFRPEIAGKCQSCVNVGCLFVRSDLGQEAIPIPLRRYAGPVILHPARQPRRCTHNAPENLYSVAAVREPLWLYLSGQTDGSVGFGSEPAGLAQGKPASGQSHHKEIQWRSEIDQARGHPAWRRACPLALEPVTATCPYLSRIHPVRLFAGRSLSLHP